MKRFIKPILIIIFALLDLCFIFPIIFKGIVNIGSFTGLGVCTFAIICTTFNKQVAKLLKAVWSKIVGKIFLCSAALIIAGILVLACIETVLMIGAAGKKAPENATVVVLGCRAFGYNPSNVLWKRLETAKKYLETHPDAVCVLSGGQGNDESVAEAECMRAWLAERGIDESRLYLEDKSTSTAENLEFSKALIEAEGLNPDIVIITSEFHEYRAGLYAQEQGFEYGAYAAPSPFGLGPVYYVRELYGILHLWWLE